MDQIRVLAGAMGAKTSQQFHGFQQVGFADAVAADDKQARRINLQLQLAVVAELLQFEPEKPNRSGCGVSLK